MPKKKNKNTKKKYGDQSKAIPRTKKAKGRTQVTNTTETVQTQPVKSAAPVENPVTAALNRTEFASRATPRPLDREGIPFMTSNEVAPYFGYFDFQGSEAVRRMADYLPHYKKIGMPDVNGKQRGRIYYGMSEIADYLKSILPEQPHLSIFHAELIEFLKACRDKRKVDDPNGEFDLQHQPHPMNSYFSMNLYHFPHGRGGPKIVVGVDNSEAQRAKRLEEFYATAQRGRPYTPRTE